MSKMYKYQYRRPEGTLYKVPLRKWNRIIENVILGNYKTGGGPLRFAEVYVSDTKITAQYLISPWGKFILVLLTPLLYMIGTFDVGASEAHRDIKRMFNQKGYGAFPTDVFIIEDVIKSIKEQLGIDNEG